LPGAGRRLAPTTMLHDGRHAHHLRMLSSAPLKFVFGFDLSVLHKAGQHCIAHIKLLGFANQGRNVIQEKERSLIRGHSSALVVDQRAIQSLLGLGCVSSRLQTVALL